MPPIATEPETPLARLIREQGRLKQWVAEQLGVGRDRVTRLAAGDTRMTLEEAVKLADVFGVPPETFVVERPEEES